MYGGELCLYREYTYYYIIAIPYLGQIETRQHFTTLVEEILNNYTNFATYILQ